MTMVTESEADDAFLLREYAERRSESAFSEIVRRHVNLVHSAALRQVRGNAAAAADITQSVFIELARQAARLSRHPTLSGWLFTATRRIASQIVRAETRRLRREQEAHTMQELLRESPPGDGTYEWDHVQPVLDAAMCDLGQTDRLAVLLRHFEHRPLADIGARLGLSENAARMRVERAMEKLRALLAKRGLCANAPALAAVLSAQAVCPAPAALGANVLAAALSAGAASTSALGFLPLMTSTQFKAAAVVLLMASAGTTLVLQVQSNQRLRASNADLRADALQLEQELRTVLQTASEQVQDPSARRDPSAELLRLRGDVAGLHRQLAEQRALGNAREARASGRAAHPLMADRPAEPLGIGGNFIPLEQWGNAGAATPEAAAMTVLWAWRSRNLDLLNAVSQPMTSEMERWLAENDPRALDEELRLERSAFMVDSVRGARAKSVEPSKSRPGQVVVHVDCDRSLHQEGETMGIQLSLVFDGTAWRIPAREVPGSGP